MAPAGFDGIEVELDARRADRSRDVEESQRILRCDRWDRPSHGRRTAPRCSDTGVRLERTITFDAEHAIADVTDRWISTDGRAHRPAARLRARRGRDRPSAVAVPRRSALHVTVPIRTGCARRGRARCFVRGPEGGMAVGALSYVPRSRDLHLRRQGRPVGDQRGDGPGRRRRCRSGARSRSPRTSSRRRRSRGGPRTASPRRRSRSTARRTAPPPASVAQGPGRATDNVGVAKLTVNGQPVTRGADGSFSAAVALGTGSNRRRRRHRRRRPDRPPRRST